ncbi:MAG: DNA/RNA nuclease SfsA [Lachnospiraceae bacterium]|nr:DNA/RNA nuclease SfsA [Lachnospiraceae bacterium]
MIYNKVKQARFVARPNRFIAHVLIDGKQEVVHVKNTGRCRELLLPDAEVYVDESDNLNRKTKWDLIGVRKGDMLINMDSNAPNKVVHEWLLAGKLFHNVTYIKPESKYKNSRFDFYVEAEGRKIYIEVKGVTLEEERVAKFPDAPSERAIKHLNELAEAMEAGYEAYVILVIQMKGVDYFTPNQATHPAFGEVLKETRDKGAKVLAYDCLVTENSLELDCEVKVILS